MRFNSYYWNPINIESPELQAQLLKLVSTDGPEDEAKAAFGALLRSGNRVAQGIALDNYFYANSLTRYGADNPYDAFVQEMLFVARDELAREPIRQILEDGRTIEGANYASALGVLSRVGDASDLELISPILMTSQDINVLATASMAAARVLRSVDAGPIVLARLAELASAARWSQDLRMLAIAALRTAGGPNASDYLARVAEAAELPYSAYAAKALCERDMPRFRGLLEGLVSRWPDDASYPANDVRRLLGLEQEGGGRPIR